MEKYNFTAEQRAAYEGLSVPFAVYQFIDKRVVTLILSDGFCELFGYKDRDKAYYDMDNDMYRDAHPDDAARIADAAVRFATEGGVYDVIYRTRKNSGNGYTIVHATGRHVFTEDGVRLAHVWYTDEGTYEEDANVRDRRFNQALSSALHEESIMRSRCYDYLTGMPNMAYFFELACIYKDRSMEEGRVPVLLYMDLSGMKFFNTRNGFAAGNKLLRELSRVMSGTFGNENCCHIGGDHFAVVASEDGLEARLRRFFDECRNINGGDSLPVRVGIYPNKFEDVHTSTAMDRAKFACDSLGDIYESAFSYYDHELRGDAEMRNYVVTHLDQALREEWIEIYYQPIVRAVNDLVCDEEALSRWIDPERGFLLPKDFIPALEDAGTIYKLDLYVLEHALEKMKIQMAMGFNNVPVSINLSRSDFTACDIVGEITRRVDAAGVDRNMITVEITESTIGSDYEFMRSQVQKFQELGFAVWMDDFGSGYSSLDVLQSIRFDLIKFDMSFMRRLDEGDDGKIILTELMKMATALGVDTVCEGVETEAQVRFLHEIGCSKMQGYYFGKAVSFSQIQDKIKDGTFIDFENPGEAEYYKTVGRINLYDLDVIASDEESAFLHFFNTLPMGIIEVNGDTTRFMRSNQSYRDFIKRYFNFDLSYLGSNFTKYDAVFIKNIVQTCCERGMRAFYDEIMPDGSVVHSFARRVGINPVNGNIAVAVAVLYISDAQEGTTYASIARALAADYYRLYYVDLDTDKFIEYSSPIGGDELAIERHGDDFFEVISRESQIRIYEDDREAFLKRFSREKLISDLDEHGVFTTAYRLEETGEPKYVNMKVMRMPGGNRIIVGISVIDSDMKYKEIANRMQQERDMFASVMALTESYLSLYIIDPETGRYSEYYPGRESGFGLYKEGEDFFGHRILEREQRVCPEDLPEYHEHFNRDNVMREINEKGVFDMQYRVMIEENPHPVSLRVAIVKELGGDKLIAGVRAWKQRRGDSSSKK